MKTACVKRVVYFCEYLKPEMACDFRSSADDMFCGHYNSGRCTNNDARKASVDASNGTQETATVDIEIIRDPKGRHTCRTRDKVCPFLGSTRLGTRHWCMFGEQKGIYNHNDDFEDYLEPVCGLADK